MYYEFTSARDMRKACQVKLNFETPRFFRLIMRNKYQKKMINSSKEIFSDSNAL